MIVAARSSSASWSNAERDDSLFALLAETGLAQRLEAWFVGLWDRAD